MRGTTLVLLLLSLSLFSLGCARKPGDAVCPSWASAGGQDQYGRWADATVSGVTWRMRWIPAGTFQMGSPVTEAEREVGETPHAVTLTQGYWLGATEVTQGLWTAVMGSNPSKFTDDDRRPVEKVSWDDSQAFIGKVNGLVPGGRFRLPTEVQWEYACRAGTTTAFSFGATITPEQVNYDGNYPYAGAAKGLLRETTVAVGSLPCNAWGLYEMHGNVSELCSDWLGTYPAGPVTDPTGAAAGRGRVVRGGSWLWRARFCRGACRLGFDPGTRFVNLGFRCAAVQ